MDCSQSDLLSVVESATRAAAAAVQGCLWHEDYAEAQGERRLVGSNDHHTAPLLDRVAHEAMCGELQARIGEFHMITEEAPSHVLLNGKDEGDLCWIADPLDGSVNARHRIPLAGSSLCAYSRRLCQPLASAVTDVFLGATYFAASHLDRAYLRIGEATYPLRTSGCTQLERASCAVLAAQPQRFQALAGQAGLLSKVRWIFGNCGAIEICRVAAGDLDLAAEFAKGFRVWDLAAACHILAAAGGACRSPGLEPMRWNLTAPESRVKFTAGATEELCAQAQKEIRW